MNRKQQLVLMTAVSCILAVGVSLTASRSSATPTASITGHVTARRASARANAVVYIETMPGVQAPPTRPVRMDQRNQKFAPVVLPIVKGTRVQFLNSDSTDHNVYSPDVNPYDLGNWGHGQSRERTFDREGVYTQLCHLHPSMIGYVVVLQNRFFAVTRSDGSFRIDGVPVGRYRLKAWQERGHGGPVDVTVTETGATIDIPLGR